MDRLDWDDLRYLLAVARHGSLSAAARALGVNHSTVLRRISALENRVGSRLFDRLPGGYVLTDAGREMQRVAAQIEQTIAEATMVLGDGDAAVSGLLRITTVDIVALYLLPGHIAELTARHPALQVELITAEASLSLTRREADVAIRATERPPESLIGRRLGTLALAVYAARDWLRAPERQGHSLDRLWTESAWVGLTDSFNHTAMGRWLRDNIQPEQLMLRVNSLALAQQAVRAGNGIGLLPCVLADRHADLVRLTCPLDHIASPLWLLTHDDLRRLARVRTFLDHMAAAFARDRDLMEGRLPQHPIWKPGG